MKKGRKLSWPEAWKEFSELFGGTVGLRDAMGYSSPTTVPDKINRRSPWSPADKKLLGFLCAEKGFDVTRLDLG
jgi:hypothetical protein